MQWKQRETGPPGVITTRRPLADRETTARRQGRSNVACRKARSKMQTEREIVSRWIEERAAERDAPALTWVFQRAAWGLLQCYPPDVGKYTLVAAVQGIIGVEPE